MAFRPHDHLPDRTQHRSQRWPTDALPKRPRGRSTSRSTAPSTVSKTATISRSPALVEARAKGDVLIVEPGLQGWVEVPPFTGELKYAKSLLPDGLYTISSEPRIVCAAALRALAITDAPPLLYLSLRSEQWG